MRMILFLAAMMLSFPAQAQEKFLQLDIAENSVDITTGFNGASVVAFGTTTEGGGSDVVVTLKGPERTMIVRRKARALIGAWMNRDNIEFRRVPSYYDYAMANSLALDNTASLLAENEIGVDNLDFYAEDSNESAQTTEVFRDALIGSMQRKGFFPIKAGGLQFIDDNFFKVTFDLPPGVPTGTYTIEAVLIREGIVLATESRTLQVGQVGFNARVYMFADDHSFFYGIMAVFLAVLSGWSAFTFLRRD